ncbi:suppressor of fused domain protein [Corynebacterium alimapuense]|uniref:Uncharacterized protein n=1 Tax=Corynebacterium alimapuense TaxID=1576874 RepID=A0A3M8K6Q2_9CORY|nr:suppressor of fused domain protein [Corynebacterium alimapuense]RNE48252.1 hypothetical protein C5L39_10390 [Corynebacterium alimapuense]
MNIEETAYWLDQIIPADLVSGHSAGLPAVTAELGQGQFLAATVDVAELDTGLRELETELPVRSELLVVARAPQQQLVDVLAAAAIMLKDAGGIVPAQPGTMLPQLGQRAGLSGFTVAHGLFIPPYLWGGEVPQITEDDRLTVALQLVLLTDSEYAFAVEEGAGALQRELGELGVDLLDWSR